MQNMEWYHSLIKPLGTPPDIVFSIVWPILYLMMGMALFFAYKSAEGKQKYLLSGIFALQLILNLSWSPLFFGAQNPQGAMFVLVCLWLAVAMLTQMFFKVSKTAGWLMVPYLLWITFAGYLNYGIIQLN